MINIPLRPANDDSKLSKVDKDIIAIQTLTGWSNERVFLLFNPHYATADWKSLNQEGKRACRQFFSFNANKYFKADYEKTLAEFLGRKQTNRVSADDGEISEQRKQGALKSLLSQAMNLVESGTDLDAEELKTVSDIFKRLNLIRENEEEQEKPRRYIPIRCGECDYRLFVESYVETGEIENSCLRCKALDIAKENGFHYDPKTLLSTIQEEDN